MSAPAVPTASSNIAPTTKVESTQEAPHGQTVSQIGTGGPPSEEAATHTGAFNTIDMYMRMQFLALASFRWSTEQNPGTLLWSTPITPKLSHQFIRHLSEMYNTWVGGFDYNIKVCGTGFHAGAIAIVRLPPNIAPNTVTSPADFTAFEYMIIDPKTLEVVTEHIIDQRRWMYHYMNDTGVDSIGGYIAAYVLVPLVTSSTGATQINVQVLTRPSMDFNFFQIKPLDAKDDVGEDTGNIDALIRALDINSLTVNSTATFTDQVTKFVIAPQTQAKPRASVAGCFKFDGTKYGTSKMTFPINPVARTTITYKKVGEKGGAMYEAFKDLEMDATAVTDYMAKRSECESGTSTGMIGTGIFSEPVNVFFNKDKAFVRLDSWNPPLTEIPAKPADESWFLFENNPDSGDQQRLCFQTHALASALKQKGFKDIMTGQDAMIIDMYDADLDTPIRRLKLYYNGFITTRGQGDQTDLPANKYYFKFVQFSRAGEPIPAPPKIYRLNEIQSAWAHDTFKQETEEQ